MSAKRWKTHLVIAALLIGFVGLAMPPRQRSAAAGDCSPTIVVTGAADSGAGTLRQALLDICPQGLITFDFPAPTTILLTSAPLVVNVSVTIDAAGAPGVTLSGGNSRRVLGVSSGVVVGLRGLTIRDGLAGYGGGILNAGILTLEAVTLTQNYASHNSPTNTRGGGIYNQGGRLMLHNSHISGNVAVKTTDDPPDEYGGHGGGIYNDNGTVTLFASEIAGNIAESGVGGGIYNDSGIVSIVRGSIDGNQAEYEGGGVYNVGNLRIASSTVAHNIGLIYGGGVSQTAGSIIVANSTFSGNKGNVGASGDYGAGLYLHAGAANLNNVTFTHNEGVSGGGGIFNENGALTMRNSIVAGNSASVGADCYGSFTNNGYNLTGQNTGCPAPGETDIMVPVNVVFTTVLSDTLADNGGPTRTHALRPYSPAVNAGNSATCAAADQRGVSRPQSYGCDMGATETESAVDLWVEYAPLEPFLPANTPFTYDILLHNDGPQAATDVIITDTLAAPLTLLSATVDGGVCGNAGIIITCTLPTLPANSAAHVLIDVQPPAHPAQVHNEVVVFAANPEAYLWDNAGSLDNAICPCTDLSLNVTDAPATPYLGDILTFTVSVVNTSTEIATNVYVTNTIPAVSTLITYTTSQGACSYVGTGVACFWGALLPGSSAQLDVAVLPGQTGQMLNTAAVDSYEIDYTPPDNALTNAARVRPAADLVVHERANPGLAVQGSPFTYTVLLSNEGPNNSRFITMTTLLPPTFSFAPALNAEARLNLHLDDPSGAMTFRDSSSYGDDLTCVTQASCPYAGNEGRYGTALNFYGDDYMVGPTGEGLNPGAELTLSLWVKTSSASADRKFLGKGQQGYGYVLGHYQNKLYGQVWDSVGTLYSFQAGNLPANTWLHVALTWKTGGDLVGYINGNEVARVPVGNYPIASTPFAFTVGRAPWSGNTFVGGMDEIMLFRRALSGNEIEALADGVYVSDCRDDDQSGSVVCHLNALAPGQIVASNLHIIPGQLGLFTYTTGATQRTYDRDLTDNATTVRTLVADEADIDLIMDLTYHMIDGSGGTNRVWLLLDGTFVDNDAETGTWETQPDPGRMILQYAPGYKCDAFSTGTFILPGPYLQGVRTCQDGSGIFGLWHGDFITAFQ